MAKSVRIVEVGPRDGLQNVKTTIPVLTKLDLIKRLHGVGLRTIEITSIVSPKAIPQLSDCRTLLDQPDVTKILQDETFRAPVLVPNLKGLEIALKHNVKEVAVFVSASEGFSRANINCSVQQGLDRARQVAQVAFKHKVAVRGYVSCIFSCPYDGPTSHDAVVNCVKQLLDMGCYEISLGDTLGVGVACDVQNLLKSIQNAGIPIDTLAGHFHDTYGQAVANIWAAYECGVRVFDSSVGGLGGCPYAPGAKGNVATEDVVYMFEQAGIKTGVNLSRLVGIGNWISEQLKVQNASRAGCALFAKQNVSTVKPKLSWTPHASFEGLEILRSGANVKVVLDRPRNGNALTTAMISKLTEFILSTATDQSISRIVFAANGQYFCTGMDLGKSSPVSQGRSASDAQFDRLSKLFDAIDKSPKVTIACVQGPAFGGGVGLAFACDIRIMAQSATMKLSEVKLGLCPATISKYIIREWGTAFSREALLSGRTITSSELARLGKIHQSIEPDLSTVLDQYLVMMKGSAPHASSMGKELIRLAEEGGSSQEHGIRRLFDEMMVGSEATFGLREFQRGNRSIDWDAYALRKVETKSKL